MVQGIEKTMSLFSTRCSRGGAAFGLFVAFGHTIGQGFRPPFPPQTELHRGA